MWRILPTILLQLVFLVHISHSAKLKREMEETETVKGSLDFDADMPATLITGTADCSCGVSSLHTSGHHRIVGGELAQISDLPWTVILMYKGFDRPFCGGTLICDRYVATAAHCIRHVDGPNDMEVWLMEQDWGTEGENAQPTIKVDVSEIILHPGWNVINMDNDITLIKLATPVNIARGSADKVTPACVPANNVHSFAGLDAVVAGWGALYYGSVMVKQLRKLQVPVIEQEVCETETVYAGYLTENMLCAGFMEGGKDACTGDSGGPLVAEQNGKFVHIGIVSFGDNCAKSKSPGVYTKVSRYGEWIQENTQDCQYCSG